MLFIYTPRLAQKKNFHGRVSRDGETTICLWLTIFISICSDLSMTGEGEGGGGIGARIYDPIVFISRRAHCKIILRIILLLYAEQTYNRLYNIINNNINGNIKRKLLLL